MKNFHRSIIILSAISLTLLTNAEASISVKHIIVGPQAGDKPTNFSLTISLHNSGEDISEWKFGFYMPRTFKRSPQSNPNLSMQICEVEEPKHCSGLNYQHPPFLQPDLSTVFTTILAPSTSFTLHQGQSYVISLKHNSSRGPQNYSALPQSLFIITPTEVLPLATSHKSYLLTEYDAHLTRESIAQRLASNWSNSSTQLASTAIIPAPSHVSLNPASGNFILGNSLMLHDLSNNPAAQTALWLEALHEDLGLNVTLDQMATTTGIVLQAVAALPNPEAYQITISAQQILVTASTPAGFFYALQSLRQLWYQQQALSAMTISDAPRFSYRGILLDVARHYFTLAELKNFITQMAALKLNTLHLHLSDDEAFRLNLSAYPQLAHSASSRGLGQALGPMAFPQSNLTNQQHPAQLAAANTVYGTSYSEDEIRQLLSYANRYQVTVIPEIDIPGHSRALIKALADSLYEINDLSSYAGYGDNSLPVCTFASSQPFSTTLTTIISQTAKLFNQQTTLYALNNEISLGGDEVFKGTWDEAPSCQVQPWKNLTSLQKEHYFFKLFTADPRLSDLKFSGWHELLLTQNGAPQVALAPTQVGHSWVWGKSAEALPKAVALANAGYPVVLDYSELLYFDMTYSAAFNEPGLYWASKFGDTYAALSSAQAASKTQELSKNPKQILGLEGALWTDVIPSYEQLQYMALPKMAGLAEAAWSPATSSPQWHSLAGRLGCGQSGFLAYLAARYATPYRGYPNGIKLEAPQACP